jgi:DNA-binding FadR family transcriptional regulator
LIELAGAVASADGDAAALLADWSFMATLVEASGNLIFQLILNSVRELYLPHAEAFTALVRGREGIVPLYLRAAEAVSLADGYGASAAIDELAGAQEARMIAA